MPFDPLQLGAHDLPVVEVQGHVGELLRRLVALARHDHDVAGPGGAQRPGDRRPAVRLDDELGGSGHPGADLLDDCDRILAARIVGRQHDDVGEARGDRAHHGPLAAIPVPAATEHDDDARLVGHVRPGAFGAHRGQHLLEAGRGVGVVDDRDHPARALDGLEPAGNPLHLPEPLDDGVRFDTEGPGRARRGERVRDVEIAAEVELHQPLAQPEAALGQAQLEITHVVQ